ncbi:hypothetical protein AB0D08_05440 [Kitasatospora sp. NPDC048540]|uniref:hypothetical protein n=1 Tax=Kitasatospora sp. NPDC048540 TaxID=3155634 RepID=UPI0033F18813
MAPSRPRSGRRALTLEEVLDLQAELRAALTLLLPGPDDVGSTPRPAPASHRPTG